MLTIERRRRCCTFVIWLPLLCLVLLLEGFSVAVGESETHGIEDYENYMNEVLVDDENADAENRNAVILPLQRWPDHTLHYTIAPDYTAAEAENVRHALSVLEDGTCLHFEPYERERVGVGPYINYKKAADKCGTRVGYNPLGANGPHDVVLNPRCLELVGVIQHETMHVLGLYHEQSRPDRGDFVRIQYDNIAPQYWSQFATYPWTTTLNVPYDFKSLMHYSQFAFAKDKSKPTMLARNGNEWEQRDMGQTNGPSVGDFTKLNKMYNCPTVEYSQ